MATDAGKVTVSIEADGTNLKAGFDKAKESVSKFSSGAGEMVKEFGKLVAGVGGIIAAFGAASVKAYGEQEVAVAQLNQALANQGRFTREASQELQDYASALQATTTFGDEQIISVQAQLTAFGLQGKQLKEVTKSTLDLAAAKGIDLKSAADLLGKAFVGETGMLSRYGIVLDDSLPKSEKFAAAQAKINQMFGGQAQAQAQTFTGQMKQLQNSFSDLQEELGALIAGEGQGLLTLLSGFTQHVTAGIKQIREFSGEFASFGDFLKANFLLVLTAIGSALLTIVETVVNVLAKIPILTQGMTAVRDAIANSRIELENLGIATQASIMQTDAYKNKVLSAEEQKKRAMASTLAAEKANKAAREAAAAEEERKHNERQARLLLLDQQIQDEITKKQEESLVARAKAIDDFFGLQANTWTQFWDLASNLVQQTFDNFGKAMADVLVDSKSFGEAMKGIWKSFIKSLISELVALIAKLVVALALKAALGLGGASVASAASNIAALTNITKKAATGGMINEPSIVTGLKSGKQILAGEAGPEAIVPSGGGGGKNMTASEMGMDFSGGGGQVTINITGQFLEGSETQWQRMFRQKILPEIRRATMYNPTGNFQRKRGATT